MIVHVKWHSFIGGVHYIEEQDKKHIATMGVIYKTADITYFNG